jgi:hypothetical protein
MVASHEDGEATINLVSKENPDLLATWLEVKQNTA